MRWRSYNLGTVRYNAVVTVALKAKTNVRLMTKDHFAAYQRQQFYRMLGGVAVTPLFKVTIPQNGDWYVVLDVDGLNSPLLPAAVSVAR
ncbi:DUF1883 domain-containing protein [Amycolatopsis sp. WAC 01375]|uniref:DUF1883 domain-containing protein n=1 Tax=unclassified Amycolatopsis TaxID=2618356 RepID=UPI000F78E59C|nr:MULTISPECIES: DUF1883 domain-containing protein [unclassified Amycolatopsis]RSM78087.1 DUF1883 domain-containing protein [Amycolatopsis sp. WAC 01375]RSN28410.1 DUF1883 domain-containing protein [Amycolatopsis sp. WAC 01416]